MSLGAASTCSRMADRSLRGLLGLGLVAATVAAAAAAAAAVPDDGPDDGISNRGPGPTNAVNITVFHVNPKHLGPKPINMDTGDSTGDLFFDLFEVILYPLSCPDGPATDGGGSMVCTNPEASSPDLMVNKVVLEVNPRYSGYAKCNIGSNGTDGHGNACKDDTYCCYCSSEPYGPPTQCNATVGREDIYDHFGPGAGGGGGGSGHHHHHSWCSSATSSVADCYREHVMQKLTPQHPGYWYSSLAKGYCDPAEGGAMGEAECTWRVAAVEKVVTRDCHSKTFGAAVQASAAPACLDGCGSQKANTSSPCWVDCFYKAALGPDSGKPNGTVAGMPIGEMVKAWEKPFLPVAEGGCPAQ